MNKGRLILAAILIASISHSFAQTFEYGAKASIGVATITDDLSTSGSILGGSVGGYINFNFAKSKSVLSEIFYLQSGVNFTRRGRNFEEVFQRGTSMSVRNGYSHVYSAQIPILAGVHMELPIQQAGHVVGVFLGPAVSYGLTGKYTDRLVSPGNPDRNLNYDFAINGTDAQRYVFNHVRRLDISAILGISYENGPFTLSVYLDHGFMPISTDKDILRIINNSQLSPSNRLDEDIPNGNNTAYLVSLAYRIGSFGKTR